MTQALTREQKQSIGLLSIGTFLEYFDLMLYVHMSVLLNELFFPQHDANTTQLLSSLGFCTTFIFRPFGALLFGWLGDTIGRKSTVIITSLMMAGSCATMAILPTYAQIGIAASMAITLCRIIQGMSSLGEIVGAGLYLTETIKPPKQYMAVAMLTVFSTLGGMAALGVASLVNSTGFSWRLAFGFGFTIAVIGGLARTYLRETPDFADAKNKISKIYERSNIDPCHLDTHPAIIIKVPIKTSLAYFFIQCTWPVYMFVGYIHCGSILKNSFGYSAEQVINNNFITSVIGVISCIILAYLAPRIYPLKILTYQLLMLYIFIFASPLIFENISTPFHIVLIQIFFLCIAPTSVPATPIFYKHFTLFKRFRYTSMIFALSRAFMYVISSFGLVYLAKAFGYYGILGILIPLTIGYSWGLHYFYQLEKKSKNVPYPGYVEQPQT